MTGCNHGGCRVPPRFKVRIVHCGGAIDSFDCVAVSDTWLACSHHLGSIICRLGDIHHHTVAGTTFPTEAIVEVLP